MSNSEELGKLVEDEEDATSRGQQVFIILLMVFLVAVIIVDFGLVVYLCSFI